MTLRTGLKLLAALVALAAAWLARDVFLLAFVSLVLATVFSFPVEWLSRRMPRGAAVLLVLGVLVTAVVAVVWLAAPTVSGQFSDFTETAPRALERARGWLRTHAGSAGARATESAGQATAKVAEKAVPAVLKTAEAFTSVVLIFVLAAFFVHAPQAYRAGLKRLIPAEHEPVFDEAYRRVATGLRKWVGGILVSMTIMGVLAALGLRAAGIRDWALLGFFTFLGTFVPYVGAIASAVPGLLVGLSQSPQHLLYAAGVYLGVHVVEGYLIQPLVMRRAVELEPALLLVGQGVMAAVFGLMGAVVATPLLVCVRALTQYFWTERRLGK